MHPQTGVPLVMLAVPVVDRNGDKRSYRDELEPPQD